MLKYADCIEAKFPQLAKDIRARYGFNQPGWPRYSPRPFGSRHAPTLTMKNFGPVEADKVKDPSTEENQ